MPFFMYLSGLVFFLLSIDKIKTIQDYSKFIQKRAFRLLLPFFLFGVFIIIGKMVASKFVFVDNLPDNFFTAIINIFWDVGKSPATSIWYVFVLFVFCLIVPPLFKATYIMFKENGIFILFFLSIALYWLPLPMYLYLKFIGKFLVFFIVGGIVTIHYEQYLEKLDKYWLVWLGIFASIFILLIFIDNIIITKFIIGFASIPAIHSLARKSFILNSKLLAILGEYTFPIYLMNTIFIGVAKGVILKFTNWDGVHFLFIAPILLISGLIFPILLRKYILSKIKFIDEMTK